MSHFLLAVLHEEWQDVDELLAPYSEELRIPPTLKYTREEAIQYAREHYKEYCDKSDETCWTMMADGYITDEKGNIYTTYNPQAKWDWYEIGGRWNDYLRVNGQHVNTARIAAIDFSIDEDAYRKSLRFWDVVISHQVTEPDENYSLIFGEKYYLDYYEDRETFARRQAMFTTHTVITSNGIWHERDEVSWLGLSSETPDKATDWDEHYFDRFIKNADPNLTMTLVDCHI